MDVSWLRDHILQNRSEFLINQSFEIELQEKNNQ